MLIRGAEPVSCFGLAGCDENAGTYALGWCLEQSAALRAELFGSMVLDPLAQVALSSQDFGMKDRGCTDLEVLSGTAFHLVFEAKRHWQVATHAQLARYVHRLADSNVQHKRLISVSAARKDWAVRHLPADVEGIPVDHLSWSEIRAMAKRALAATRNQIERLWLDQLALHLSEYGMTSNAFDSLAYVVSLSRDLMPSSQELTWIDVVTKQGKYFHPIGGNGWPTVPPAYIGFRYLSQFRSVHFIERVDTVDRLQDVDPHWPETHSPHFVYTLGPAMRPATVLPLGNIYYTARHRVALDLLLSGKAATYEEAVALTRDRQAQRGEA